MEKESSIEEFEYYIRQHPYTTFYEDFWMNNYYETEPYTRNLVYYIGPYYQYINGSFNLVMLDIEYFNQELCHRAVNYGYERFMQEIENVNPNNRLFNNNTKYLALFLRNNFGEGRNIEYPKGAGKLSIAERNSLQFEGEDDIEMKDVRAEITKQKRLFDEIMKLPDIDVNAESDGHSLLALCMDNEYMLRGMINYGFDINSTHFGPTIIWTHIMQFLLFDIEFHKNIFYRLINLGADINIGCAESYELMMSDSDVAEKYKIEYSESLVPFLINNGLNTRNRIIKSGEFYRTALGKLVKPPGVQSLQCLAISTICKNNTCAASLPEEILAQISDI